MYNSLIWGTLLTETKMLHMLSFSLITNRIGGINKNDYAVEFRHHLMLSVKMLTYIKRNFFPVQVLLYFKLLLF